MSHISIVRSNVKACPEEVLLEPLTAIVGPPQSGKTSILQAITFARTGKHPGTNPRQPNTYLKFVPEGADALYSMIAGEGLSATLRVTTSKPGKRTHEVSGDLEQDVVPIAAVAAELWDMGPPRMREAVFKRFGNAVGRPKPKHLDPESEALWAEASKGVKGEGVDFLSGIAKELGRIKREKNAAKKYVDTKIGDLRGPAAVSTAGIEKIPQLEDDLLKALEAERVLSAKTQLAALRKNIELTEGLLADAEANLVAAQARKVTAEQEMETRKTTLQQLEAQAEALPNVDSSKLDRVNTMIGVMEVRSDNCPLCQHEVSDWDPHIERLQAARDKRQAAADAVEQTRKQLKAQIQAQLQDITNAASATRQAISSAQLARDSIQTKVAHLKSEERGLIKGIGEAESYDGRHPEAIQEELERLREAVRKREEMEDLASDSLRLQAESDKAKLLEGGAVALVDRLVADVATQAEAAVNEEMPPGLQAKLNLSKGAEWQVVGADGRPHSKATLCGNELAALRTALALTWTKGSGTFRCLQLDADQDLNGLHGSVFTGLLRKLAEKRNKGDLDQVIITWPHKADIPDGWHVVDLGGKS